MDSKESLLTAARRYCMERHAFWAEAYRQLDASAAARVPVDGFTWDYSEQAHLTFPRYLVWEAILSEIERVRPGASSSLDSFRLELAAAGFRAQTMMTTNEGRPATSISAMEEERQAFRDFVLTVSESRLSEVEPLPTRRGFDAEELQRVWLTLNKHWDVTPQQYWWPLRAGVASKPVLAFHTDWFTAEKVATMCEVLVVHNVVLVWEVREFGQWGCEESVQNFDPSYNGEEGYWTSETADWLVYASHESSISIAGEWLLSGFRKAFPDCDHFQYRGPMSTADGRGTWSS